MKQELLQEIGNNPAMFKKMPSGYETIHLYKFFVENIPYVAKFEQVSPGIFEYEFYLVYTNEDGEQIMAYALYKQPMSVVFRVLSTIINILRQFIKIKTPEIVFFTAQTHEASRVSYYRSLVKRNNIPGYIMFEDKDQEYFKLGDDETIFILLRKDDA